MRLCAHMSLLHQKKISQEETVNKNDKNDIILVTACLYISLCDSHFKYLP